MELAMLCSTIILGNNGIFIEDYSKKIVEAFKPPGASFSE
jgi:hypothetical protein